MAYRKDFRWCVVNNINQGMTWDGALKIFQISRRTLSKWLKMAKPSGELSDPPRKAYPTRKIAADKLRNLVEEQPDCTLSQYAQQFDCCHQAVANRLHQLGITRKKKRRSIKKEMKKRDNNILISLKI